MTEDEYRALEPLYDTAKAEIPTWPHISVGRVQRKWMLGYNRASRLLETLAAHGALRWDKMTGVYSSAVGKTRE